MIHRNESVKTAKQVKETERTRTARQDQGAGRIGKSQRSERALGVRRTPTKRPGSKPMQQVAASEKAERARRAGKAE